MLNRTATMDRKNLSNMLTDRGEFLGLLADCADQKMVEADLPGLILGGNRCRLIELPFLTGSMVSGDLSFASAMDRVWAGMHHHRGMVMNSQPQGDWQYVAAEAVTHTVHRRNRKMTDESVAAQKAWTMFSGQIQPPTMKPGYEIVERIVLRLALVDVSNQPEYDNWEARTGRTDGSLHGGRIPPAMAKDYAAARDLMLRYYIDKVWQRWEKGQPELVDTLKAQGLAVDDALVAGVVGVREDVEDGVVLDLPETKLRMIQTLLGKGFTYQDVAKLIEVDGQPVNWKSLKMTVQAKAAAEAAPKVRKPRKPREHDVGAVAAGRPEVEEP